MNALPSFTPPPQKTQVRKQKRRRNKASASRNAHRRQAVEASTKLITYGVLSMFGMVTLTHLVSYNWSQQSKLHYLQGALKTTQNRAKQLNADFGRSFDRQLEKSVMQENSYKIAPDRLPIAIVDPSGQVKPDPVEQKDGRN